jgi:TonB family protein
VAFSDLTYEVRRPPRWDRFLTGLAIDVASVLLLIGVGPHLTTAIPRRPSANNYSVTLIAPITLPAPPVIAISSQPVAPQLAKAETPKAAPSPAVDVKPPKLPQSPQPSPKPELPKLAASVPPVIPVKPSPTAEIKTNVFAAEKSDAPTVHRPAREVQTGGFGDPNGVSGQGDPKRGTVTVASLGSFELPSGPGRGNGTGGSHGVSGTVRAAGFGDGVAAPGPHGRGDRSTVVASGFGDAVAQGGGAVPEQVQKKPELQPVEIVYKPRPAYTPEALRQRVEGEVLLEVVFTASGSLHINRVVKGLGYGLDDKALAAAQRIQFRPARRDGQPYDCAALVHIIFELAE